jgi:hypothetical protein
MRYSQTVRFNLAHDRRRTNVSVDDVLYAAGGTDNSTSNVGVITWIDIANSVDLIKEILDSSGTIHFDSNDNYDSSGDSSGVRISFFPGEDDNNFNIQLVGKGQTSDGVEPNPSVNYISPIIYISDDTNDSLQITSDHILIQENGDSTNSISHSEIVMTDSTNTLNMMPEKIELKKRTSGSTEGDLSVDNNNTPDLRQDLTSISAGNITIPFLDASGQTITGNIILDTSGEGITVTLFNDGSDEIIHKTRLNQNSIDLSEFSQPNNILEKNLNLNVDLIKLSSTPTSTDNEKSLCIKNGDDSSGVCQIIILDSSEDITQSSLDSKQLLLSLSIEDSESKEILRDKIEINVAENNDNGAAIGSQIILTHCFDSAGNEALEDPNNDIYRTSLTIQTENIIFNNYEKGQLISIGKNNNNIAEIKLTNNDNYKNIKFIPDKIEFLNADITEASLSKNGLEFKSPPSGGDDGASSPYTIDLNIDNSDTGPEYKLYVKFDDSGGTQLAAFSMLINFGNWFNPGANYMNIEDLHDSSASSGYPDRIINANWDGSNLNLGNLQYKRESNIIYFNWDWTNVDISYKYIQVS